VQLAVMRDQYPTLTARTRRICQMMSETTVTAIREEIRLALPYVWCHSPEVGEGYLTEDNPVTVPSSTSPIPPSGRNTGINLNLGVSAFEPSQLEDKARLLT